MNALSAMHAALRPNGLLLDIRPAATHACVEVQVGEQVTRLGQLDESLQCIDIQTAEAALQTAIDAQQFVRERKTTFEFVIHFDGVDAWLGYMAERWKKAGIAGELIARARELLPPRTPETRGPGSELRVLRDIEAARLRRP